MTFFYVIEIASFTLACQLYPERGVLAYREVVARW